MEPLTLTRLAEVTGGRLAAGDPADDRQVGPDVVIDSRRVTPGALFVALAGEHVDGHDYLGAAAEAGAGAYLVQRIPDGLDDRIAAACVVVDDPVAALGRLGRSVIDALPELTVIGITGSSGKTSTKDLLAQLLADAGETVAPEGSYNNEIGVPLTATRADASTRFLISEMGARGRGHISYLCELTPPSIGVVLNVGQAHVGEFGSRDAIAVAKGELVEALPSDGWAVLNGTDSRVSAMAERTSARVALFSAAGQPDQPADLLVWADEPDADDLDRYSFTLVVERKRAVGVEQPGAETQRHAVALRLVGRHQVANAVAAAAAAIVAGLDPAQVATGLSAATSRSRWRMEVSERGDGVVVLNDAYNANPDSMMAALESLAAMVRRRRHRPGFEQARGWAVLGEMLELGDTARAEHEAVGRAVGQLGIDHLVALGADAEAMVDAARVAGCPDPVVAGETGEAIARVRPEPGDLVLVKASRLMALERVAEALLAADPTDESGTRGATE
ncbi:hypothetical protein CGZ98_05810 [Enemella evansiae]|uniref:UDP-N-acetylmuramoyl-tripeptide--D-alanyl-D- alanine ligase n=1 Tax=Enemella evansiae TaxID=2016499 RepID=UPI000B974A3A|nr:UDP-N-acetylmuramoyl-tripeptide--D-alanyl-D-alanine ligase [Enemella evansiae]OYO13186.1 hypothetical protein CGZ98_05810 [Enemella evansiae]